MAERSSEYWRDRFRQLEEAQNDTSVQTMQEIERQFRRTEQALDGKINAWYQRFAANNEISMIEARRLLNSDELKEFQWDVDDYIKYGKENAIDERWMKQLENASAKVHISRLEALKIQTQQEAEKLFGNYSDAMDKHISSIYTSAYYHTAFEVQRGIGVGWDMQKFNEEKVSDIIHKPWAADGRNFSERIWTSKTQLINNLHDSLTRMCITGESPDRAIREISQNMKVSRAQAARIVQTESAAFSAKAQESCYTELDIEEFEVVETLDSHTCPTCGDMDRKHFPMKDYVIGVTVPPFHPNCRGCTCPYFDDEFTNGKRIARGEDGQQYYVPEKMTYKQWQKSFVEGGGKELLTEIRTPLLSHDIAEIDYRAEKVTFKDLQEWKKSIGNVTEDEYSIISGMNEAGYIRTANSYKINEAMRNGSVHELSEESQKTIETLKKVIDRNVSDTDAVLIRKVDKEYLKRVYNIDADDLNNAVKELNSKKLGEAYIDKGFVSTSYKANKNLNGNDAVELEIYAPKGTNMFLTKNREESEIILQAGTRFELEGAVMTDDGKARLLMKVVGEPLEKAWKSDTIVSGAISGARNPFSDKAKEHAQKYYGLVRSMKTDVAKISRATGMSEDEVQSVKNFIFLEKHDLGGKELEYFQPDYMMAESWQRLIEGKPEQHDLTLLKHEVLEKELMEKGLSQEKAHIQASKKYNYSKEAGEYYAKIEKYKD